MIIHQPEITTTETHCILTTSFTSLGKTKALWYKVPLEYHSFLAIETADAALVGLLVLAMKTGEDIHVEGTVSERLHYGLSTYLIKAIALAYPKYHLINITADAFSSQVFNNENVAATGLSCGIDSFATIATHMGSQGGFDIKYLTYFNAGSHGVYGGEIANKVYQKRLVETKKFAKKLDLPLIIVDSNIMEVLDVNFQSLHTLIHLSCVLNLQKRIKTYYYASSFRFDFYNINGINSSWDILILNLLETESINFYSSASQYTRFERTEIVANYEPSYHFLDVCTAAQNASKINCSKCEKCLRTQISLELIGKLKAFENVFDLDVYKKNRNKFLSQLVRNKNQNQTNKELFKILKERNQITPKHYVLDIFPAFRKKLYKLKKWVNN